MAGPYGRIYGTKLPVDLDQVRLTSFLEDSCQSPPCTDSHSSAKKIKNKTVNVSQTEGLNNAIYPVISTRVPLVR